MANKRASALLSILKGLLAAAAVTLLGMALIAALVLTARLSDGVLTLLNQLLKALAVVLGVRAAVVPIILCALLKLTKSALKDWLCWLVALGAAALSLFTGLSNILIVVLGAAAGLLAMEVKTRHDLH